MFKHKINIGVLHIAPEWKKEIKSQIIQELKQELKNQILNELKEEMQEKFECLKKEFNDKYDFPKVDDAMKMTKMKIIWIFEAIARIPNKIQIS